MNDILLNTYLKEYIEKRKKDIKPSTYTSWILYLTNILTPYFKDIKLNEITKDKIQEFINYLLKEGKKQDGIIEGYSLKTVKNIYMPLELALKEAMDNEIINIFDTKPKYPKNTEPDTVECYTRKETIEIINTLCQEITPQSLGIIICMLCGLRIGEICALKYEDIDFKERTLSVNKTIERIYNAETKKSEVIIGTPKTEKSYRTIPIPSKLIPILRKMNTGNDIYVCNGKNTPTEPRTYRQWFNNCMKKHGFKIIKFHGLRHTFAMRAIEESKFDIKNLSLVLGHESPAFTLGVYGRADLTQSRKGMEAMDKFL